MMSSTYTCITCQVLFQNAELQRDHYKLDWHRYNLKRKVASIPPVTLDEFEQRAKEHREQAQNTERDESVYCKCCSKLFNTKNAYNNHLNSKKHKLAEEKTTSNLIDDNKPRTEKKEDENSQTDSNSFEKVDVKPVEPGKFVLLNTDDSCEGDIETDSDIEELDSDEWEECRIKGSDSLIKPRDCLFCSHHSKNMVKNLKHMSEAHSFFIPDVEYCVDIKNLLLYLGEKISQGFMCLWCNEAGRTFYSMEAARAHMVDKGHCKILHEGIALAEYADYYDYSASYPDNDDGEVMDVDEEVEAPVTLEEEEFQLVLPSGVTVGHRSLMKYYKQNLSQNSQALVKKSDRKLHRLLGVYRALGWAPKEQALAAKKARDIHFMKRVQSKWEMKMSMKNNKFQKHYRPQVNF